MMFVISIVFAAFVVINSQIVNPNRDYRYNSYYDESPKPYAFNYNAILEDGVGQSSRTETADGSGRVQGSYTVTNDEGHTRIVDYIADQDGFRATIRTNEPGTDNKNPADVVIESTAAQAYQYKPLVRRPFYNAAAVESVAPIEPVVPENVIRPFIQPRPIYRRPTTYNTNRNIRPYIRN